jgi:hypothetical protein
MIMMNLNEFFDACERFFDTMKPNYNEYNENNENNENYDDIKNEIDSKFWEFLDNFF